TGYEPSLPCRNSTGTPDCSDVRPSAATASRTLCFAIHPPVRKLFARPRPFASSVSSENFTTLRSSSDEYSLIGTSCPQPKRQSRGVSVVPQNVGPNLNFTPDVSKSVFHPWMWSAFSSFGPMALLI